MAYGSSDSSRQIDKLRTDVDELLVRNAILEHRLPSGTDGGTSLTTITADSTVWTADTTHYTADATTVNCVPRPLNTVSYDESEIVESLAGNVFILDAGTYKIKGVFIFHHSDKTRLEIWDATNGLMVACGLNGNFKNNVSGVVDVNGIVSPRKKTSYMIRYKCERSQAGDGLGIACGFGPDETYGSVEITRLNHLKP